MKNKIRKDTGTPYSTIVVPDVTTENEPCFMAYHPELEGCMSHGNTPEEAVDNLREVTELYISMLEEKGLEIPSPQGIEVTWNVIISSREQEVETYSWPSIAPPTFVPA
jgi:predicted RNase H-like HicB family nuclease